MALKRGLIVLVLLMMGGTLSLAQQDYVGAAAFAYEQDDYLLAIDAYQAAIAEGQTNGAIFFNLGNAYYESDNLGRALLNYQRAAQYLPRDVDLQLNIARVRAERNNTVTNQSHWLTLVSRAFDGTLSIRELSYVVLGLWFLVAVLFSAGLFIGFSLNVRVLMGGAGLIFLVLAALLALQVWTYTERPQAVVVDDVASVWSGPGEDYQVIYRLSPAAEIRIVEEREDWLRFVLPDSRQGWINRADVGYIRTNLG